MALSASLLLLVSASAVIAADPFAAIQSVTQEQWDALNATVGGGLFQAAPFARPCFENANVTTGTFDPDQCQIVQANYLNASSYQKTYFRFLITDFYVSSLPIRFTRQLRRYPMGRLSSNRTVLSSGKLFSCLVRLGCI